MNDDIINSLDDNWDDDKFGNDDGEDWKNSEFIALHKALSKKWNEVIFTLNGLLDFEEDNNKLRMPLKEMAQVCIADAYIVMAKLRGATVNLYTIHMENASLIRYYAQSIQSSMLVLIAEGGIDESNGMALRTQINEFKALFKQWVTTFKKDEYEDDWGLFI